MVEIAIGILFIVSVPWMRWRFAVIRKMIADRGEDPARFDRFMSGRFIAATSWATAALGVLVIVLGVLSL